jgi:Fe-S-cluster-containing dehydrogenase component
MSESQDKQDRPVEKGGVSRRDLLKMGGAAGVAVAVLTPTAAPAAGKALKGKRLAMVLDLQRCTGCGGCVIACKSENNIQTGVTWCKTVSKTVGKFPNIKIDFYTTMCNHCENAPCVRACPTGAMHKADGDITAHDPVKCIGCKTCKAMCPYDVISLNRDETHKFWRRDTVALKGCTSSSKELAQKVKANVLPYYNKDKEKVYPDAGLRHAGIPEKCTFCDHRTREGKRPFCVDSCPANARIVGDLNDPNSEVSKLLGKYRAWRLNEHLGTEPKVFYIRSFNAGGYESTKGSV